MRWPKPMLDLLDQATRLAPIVVVGGLAAYTWWLVQSTPSLGSGRGLKAPSTVPDYVLQQAVIERFDEEGTRVSVLRGDRMSHVVQGDRLTVEQPRMVGLDADGQKVNAQASLGHYRATDEQLDLLGQAHVVLHGDGNKRGAITFDGESLSVDVHQRLMSSTQPVRITRSDGVVQGSAMRHDGNTGVTDLSGRVHGRLEPHQR
jgi:lipopolysaccharide export system protein LptC